MTRSVVFKTPGKLDLRSIMTFGLNAKPATGHPIGFFGTGLKYAIAVLAREEIPVTIYIDQTKWTVEVDKANFRGKEFKSISLRRHRKMLGLGKTIQLPFTTELGKTWQLWQAFRELESNTRDEKGETYVTDSETYHDQQYNAKGYTCICVQSEAFVQEYYDRDKTFLKDGLTMQSSTEDVQVFDRPANAIYYRGIRVLDLKEEERSNLTYNILRQMELTEDRTLKSRWDADYYISQAIVRKEDPEIIERVVRAKPESFEGKLNLTYGSPSKNFLDIAEAITDGRNHAAASMVKHYRPPPVKASTSEDWFQPIIDNLREGDEGDIIAALHGHHEEVIQILTRAQAEWYKEQLNNGLRDNDTTDSVHDDGREVEDRPNSIPTATGNSLLDQGNSNVRTQIDDEPF